MHFASEERFWGQSMKILGDGIGDLKLNRILALWRI
jgi:hypothetical protein